jgi:Spy/CpxP family protein refolding chaperone
MSVSRISAVLSLSALAWACNNEAPAPEDTKSEPVASATATQNRRTPNPLASGSATPRRPTFRPRGVSGQFITAALALDLKDDQRASIKKLEEASATDRPADGREAMQALNKEIVEGIKAGKLDTAKLEPHYADMEKADKTRDEGQAKILGDLHAALQPEQRKALVAALKAKDAEREPPAGAAKPPEPPKPDPAKEKERKAEMNKREVERLTRELGLDEAQQKQAEAAVAKKKEDKGEDRTKQKEANKKRMEKLYAEFEKDKFDASKLELTSKSTMRDHAKSQVDYVNALLKIVKPEQRDKLAATIERGHGMGMGRGMMDRGMMGGRPGWGRGPGGPGGHGGPGGPPGGPGGPGGPGAPGAPPGAPPAGGQPH